MLLPVASAPRHKTKGPAEAGPSLETDN